MKKVIISLGNPLKTDDDIGNIVLDKLKQQVGNADYTFIKAGNSPENFLLKIKKQNPDFVFFIDAAHFDGRVGEVSLFELSDIAEHQFSTHNIPISFFDGHFKNIKLIGIKVENTDFGEGLSREMGEKVEDILVKVRSII